MHKTEWSIFKLHLKEFWEILFGNKIFSRCVQKTSYVWCFVLSYSSNSYLSINASTLFRCKFDWYHVLHVQVNNNSYIYFMLLPLDYDILYFSPPCIIINFFQLFVALFQFYQQMHHPDFAANINCKLVSLISYVLFPSALFFLHQILIYCFSHWVMIFYIFFLHHN